MTNIKKIVAAIMAAATLATSAVCNISASAANITDANFNITVQSGMKTSNSNSRRLKTNASSTYVNYAKRDLCPTGRFGRGYVYGSDTATSALVDLSSYDSHGNARPDAVVTRGSTGYIYQLINETFGANAYAQLYGSKYQNYTGTARGCWSSDSVGSGYIYNAK